MRKSTPALSDDAVPVARAIREILARQDRHHVEVSLQAGLGSGYIRDLLRAKSKNPNHEDLLQISRVLGVPITAFSQEGAVTSDQVGGHESYTEEEIALIDLWRLLSPEGQDQALTALAKLITRFRRRK